MEQFEAETAQEWNGFTEFRLLYELCTLDIFTQLLGVLSALILEHFEFFVRTLVTKRICQHVVELFA